MNHPDFSSLIDAAADGELSPEDEARLRAHLAGCDICRHELAMAEAEVYWLRAALAPPANVPNLLPAVMGRTVGSRPVQLWPRAVAAGVAGNLVTAAILVGLSTGGSVSFGGIIAIALLGGILWGALKGLAFGRFGPHLPGGTVRRGFLFGAGLWLLVNAVLAAIGGYGQAAFSSAFLLGGSLLHFLLYGLLVSVAYTWFTRPALPGPTGRRGAISLAILPIALLPLAAPRYASPAGVDTPTPQAFFGTQTPIATMTPQPIADPTAAMTPTPVPAGTGTATAAATITVTPVTTATPTGTPRSSPTPRPTTTASPTPTPSALGPPATPPPVQQQVRTILPEVINPTASRRSVIQRTRDVVVLLNFL